MERKVTQSLLSEHLYTHLDQLGFGRQRILERIHFMEKFSTASNISAKRILNSNSVEQIIVGSQREGTGLFLYNDYDLLQINHDVMCHSDLHLQHENGKVIFRLVDQKASPGYFCLMLLSKYHENKIFDKLKYALVDEQDGQYLSSKLFMQRNDDMLQLLGDRSLLSKITHNKCQKGPSHPKYTGFYFESDKYFFSLLDLNEAKTDYVRAFPSTADNILLAWCSRKRYHNWPSQKTIALVKTLPVHVVPVGQTGSTCEDLQWRISFTLAEIHLVQTFNNTQTKMLVLLKLVAKHYLKLSCKSMTSYVMKTVMLWLAETKPQKKFQKKDLIARLYDALRFLQLSVQKGCLQSYMIPERNLFAGRLKDNEREKVIDQIDFLLINGSRLISDYFYKQNVIPDLVYKLCGVISIMNITDKLMLCQLAVLNTEQLAEYCTSAFLYKSKWNIILDTIVFYVFSIRTFGSHSVFVTEETLEIPLNKYLTIDSRTYKDSMAKPKNSGSNTVTPGPDLDLFVDEEKANQMTFFGVFQTILMSFLLACGIHVGFVTGAEVYAHLIGGYLIGILGYFLIVFYLVIQTIYKLERRYNKQTYIENIGTSSMKIKIYIPKILHKSSIRWGWLFYMVCVIYVIAVGIKYPAELNSIIPPIIFTVSCTCLQLLRQAIGQINKEKI